MRTEKKFIPMEELLRLTQEISFAYGLPQVEEAQLPLLYEQETFAPLVVWNKEGMMWVDKYYVAYKRREGDERYVALTQEFIDETRLDFNQMRYYRRTGPGTRLAEKTLSLFEIFCARGGGIWLSRNIREEYL